MEAVANVRNVRNPAEKVKEPCGPALSIGALHFVAHEVERHNCAGKDRQPEKRTLGSASPPPRKGHAARLVQPRCEV